MTKGRIHQVYVKAVDEPMVRRAQELSGTNFSEMVVQAVREYIRRQGKAMEEAANGADKEGGSDE
jgi:hypothetical protein